MHSRRHDLMNPALQLSEVEFRYGPRAHRAITDVSFMIEEGESLGIVGESGCGKSTLGRLLVGALYPTRGTVEVRGRPWRAVRRRDPVRRQVQMIFQDPYGSLNPWQTPLESIVEVIRAWERVRYTEATRRAELLLAAVGLMPDVIRRRPDRLSGGQCQRVGIARALATDPQVLVADEPTSSLDVSVQAQILNLLRDIQAQRRLALVLISHDLSVIRYLTDRAIVMHEGRIVEGGATEKIFTEPRHPYTQVLVKGAWPRGASPSAGDSLRD
jgi:ABC-type dipeptide/oligopeptide/nickel transport system ATPase subunit